MSHPMTPLNLKLQTILLESFLYADLVLLSSFKKFPCCLIFSLKPQYSEFFDKSKSSKGQHLFETVFFFTLLMSLRLFLISFIHPYKIKYYFLKSTHTHSYVHACPWLYTYIGFPYSNSMLNYTNLIAATPYHPSRPSRPLCSPLCPSLCHTHISPSIFY